MQHDFEKTFRCSTKIFNMRQKYFSIVKNFFIDDTRPQTFFRGASKNFDGPRVGLKLFLKSRTATKKFLQLSSRSSGDPPREGGVPPKHEKS